MKASILAYSGALIAFIMLLTLSTIIMKSSYIEVVEQNLNDSIEYSIYMLERDRNLVRDKDNYINSSNELSSWTTEDANDEMKKEFVQYFSENLSANIENVNVHIYGADAEKGVLSVKITADFRYPTGKIGTIETDKTMILNREKR